MNADVPPPARTASCACGGLSVTCPGEPMLVALCHCRECQKRTGGPFGVAAFYPEAAVITEGASTTYRRTGDSGEEITFHFCPTCGTTVWYQGGPMPDAIAVPVGLFTDPDFPPPKFSVWEARKHPWVTIPGDEVEHYD